MFDIFSLTKKNKIEISVRRMLMKIL